MLLGKPERIIKCNSEFLRGYKTYVENATHPVILTTCSSPTPQGCMGGQATMNSRKSRVCHITTATTADERENRTESSVEQHVLPCH